MLDHFHEVAVLDHTVAVLDHEENYALDIPDLAQRTEHAVDQAKPGFGKGGDTLASLGVSVAEREHAGNGGRVAAYDASKHKLE